ncbi:Ig-like domain (group 2) [Pseudobutyrivibrio sp. 49]|uniref:DUF6273 domain-containing protein n=1 Tax=Pseudobutyrivibrio sp. 49 TaxID=1855344 RepID=UPI000884085D|nr:DUF6273 domain-containing protein [Pseudobutyrivibrio sp. 49]SDI82436.1 Ig-like domain (group 2) [Pseudobutyrivibrio sp. 49]
MKKIYLNLKNLMAFGMAVIMLASFIANPITAEAAKKKGSGNATYAVGDNIAFGNIDGGIISWTILTYDDKTKMAFVTTRKPLASKSVTAYREAIAQMFKQNGTKAGYVRWSENYWRGWLNQTFYKQCFNDAEREMIQKTTLSEQDAKNSIMNYYHDTSMDADYVGGKEKNALNMAIYNSQTTTADYIFFLSSDEYTANKDTIKNETLYMFPLRTNTYDDPTYGLFGNDTDKLIHRMYYYGGDSIRPAMYVKLGEPEEEATDSKSSDSKSSKSSSTKTTSTSDSKTTSSTSTSTAKAETTEAKSTSTRKYANNGTNEGDISLPEDSDHSMKPGDVAQVAIDMDYLNSTDKQFNCTYTTSDANVVTIDSNGQVIAVNKGSANVTVRMRKSNGKIYTMSCRIDVT